jgi:hypothetical protein
LNEKATIGVATPGQCSAVALSICYEQRTVLAL